MASTEDGSRHEVAATAAEAGERLDRLLAGALPELSRTRLKHLIEEGRIRAGGKTITEPSYRVKPGDMFEVEIPPPEPAEPAGQEIALDIIYEDDDLLVVNKPAGMVVHPAPGNRDGTLVNALIEHCGAGLSGIGGVRRPGIVHRLDKDTSGLMVVAKNDAAHAALSADFKARNIDRAYLALVWGRPLPSKGEIEGAIGRNPQNRKKMAVLKRGGKPALTRYRVIRPMGPAVSLIECRLATGRTHQIRVHLAHIGHPVVADPVYGGGFTPARRKRMAEPAIEAMGALNRQALHAYKLGFTHPISGEKMTFERQFPHELEHLRDLLESA